MFNRVGDSVAGGGMALVCWPAAACSAAEFKLEGEPKVAMIIFAQKNDGGWSQAFDEARQQASRSRMGIRSPSSRTCRRTPPPSRPPAELFIQRGYNVIIGIGLRLFRHVQGALRRSIRTSPSSTRAGTTNGPNLILLRPHL